MLEGGRWSPCRAKSWWDQTVPERECRHVAVNPQGSRWRDGKASEGGAGFVAEIRHKPKQKGRASTGLICIRIKLQKPAIILLNHHYSRRQNEESDKRSLWVVLVIILHRRRKPHRYSSSVYRNRCPFAVWNLCCRRQSWWNVSTSTFLPSIGSQFFSTNIPHFWAANTGNNSSHRKNNNFHGYWQLSAGIGSTKSCMASTSSPSFSEWSILNCLKSFLPWLVQWPHNLQLTEIRTK